MGKLQKYGTLHYPRCGSAYYGQAVGILMISDDFIRPPAEGAKVPITFETFCRVPGDVGNATSFEFPVQYKLIRNLDGNELLQPAPTDNCRQRVIQACKELELEGARAIATFCGFMAYFQKDMAAAVDIPVFSSAILQVPLVSRIVAPRKVAVLTASAALLSPAHLAACGITEDIPCVVWGMDRYTDPAETLWVTETDMELRTRELERRVVHAAQDCLREHPDVGAFVLECTNMPPASYALQEATGMPVFDVITMNNCAHDAVVRHRFCGHM